VIIAISILLAALTLIPFIAFFYAMRAVVVNEKRMQDADKIVDRLKGKQILDQYGT
jgi:hypothetical protein